MAHTQMGRPTYERGTYSKVHTQTKTYSGPRPEGNARSVYE